MGGKSYYCDYCCCFMKNDLNVRKLHNGGIFHTIAKTNYMRRYEDPKKILDEERRKTPCKRFFGGYCKFETYCKYCHYSEKELQELERLVLAKKKANSKKRKKSTKWPWKTHTQTGLPISLQPIQLARLERTNFELSWG
ncbi:zinc finger matrin-type protein 5 isoform X1 [Drosophila subpulchrella]|uniref:zinc finger matrin-type protein 5 isoform X1 n=1 Tax=Drosophila subpulchrella TaxID=1486046 RepID=UPI0018A14025|nr:zinc finger matrin-type protein 5 isoform X1 [Drosophila subpulchrella]